MRKALIAAIVATARFAVGAFAASFAVEAEDVASGSDPVATCTDSVDIDFNEIYVATTKSWEIPTVTVTLTGSDNACDGASATLILQNDGTPTEVDDRIVYQDVEIVAIDGATDVVQFDTSCSTDGGVADCTQDAPISGAWSDLPVASVWNAALLINGEAVANFDGVNIETPA